MGGGGGGGGGGRGGGGGLALSLLTQALIVLPEGVTLVVTNQSSACYQQPINKQTGDGEFAAPRANSNKHGSP